ncbi:transporter [Ganoderma sinense ZZ0214-1]|uniref:Transporter n=1 Tax=Ganoderma sinense ZZ0214-1 TaxID=1077348 RepID=A0A2G8RRM7_9APHY|nr:transporter [Ganoderma sinense ZZ0214-1]
MSQRTIKLNDGREIPWLGFGTGTALYGKDAETSVSNAIAKGFVHLDGAQMYQNEDSLGKAIAASGVPREKLFVTTKLYKLGEGETVRDSLLQSLKKLHVDYVDLYLIHVPQDFGRALKDIWRQFEDLKTEGLAKSIGVSNCRISDFAALGLDEPGGVRIPPAINQIEYHPYVYVQSTAVLDYHQKHNIVTASYGGLSPIFREKGGPVDPVLDTVRERIKKDTGKEVSPGQVLGLWLRALGVPQITTTSKESRLLEYLDTLTLPDLSPEDVKAISDAGSKLQSRQFPRFMKE